MPSRERAGLSGWWVTVVGLVVWALAAIPELRKMPSDELFIYPYIAVVELLPVPFCLRLMRTDRGLMRARWLLFASCLMLHSVSYWPSAAEQFGWVQARGGAWLGTGLWAAAGLLALLSITVFSERTTKTIRWIDGAQTSVLCLVYLIASCSGTGFSQHHLAVGDGLLLFELAVALAAYFEMRGSAAALFPGTLLFYFTARTATHFITNVWGVQSSASWSMLVVDLAFPVPSLWLCWYAARHAGVNQIAHSSERVRPAVLRSLLPLMVTVSGVLIAPVACSAHPFVSSAVVLLFVGAYATRTHLLYRLIMQEQRTLEMHAGRLERLASEDALTGLRNRRWFEARAGQVLESGHAPAVSLLLVDTDRFKEINDTFGHREGDHVLRAVAQVLLQEVSLLEEACCARIGGDEFAVLLPGTRVNEATAVAERVRRQVRGLPFESGPLASVSIGVTEGRNGMALTQLLELADAALYQAKGAGRDAVRTVMPLAEAAGMVSRGVRRLGSGLQRAEAPPGGLTAVQGG